MGAVVRGKAKVGESIAIKAKSGKSWNAKVSKVIWSGDNKFGLGVVTIVKTEKKEKSPSNLVGKTCLDRSFA